MGVVTARAGSVPHERVLAVGAHPDDIEIGAGGTLLAHRASGDSVTILTLTGAARGGDAALARFTAERDADEAYERGLVFGQLLMLLLVRGAIGAMVAVQRR